MIHILITLLCLLLAIGIALRISPSFIDRVIVSSLVLFSAITISGAILGTVGVLQVTPWCLLCLTLTVGIYLMTKMSVAKKESNDSFSYPGHVALAFIMCSVALVVIALLTVTIFEPSNIDDLHYHYAKILHWIRSTSFSRTGIELVDAYPQNGEILAAYITLVSGTISLADSLQVWTLPLVWASVFRLIQSFEITTPHAIIGAVLATAFPAFTSLIPTLHVDIMALAYLLSATSLLFSAGHLSPNLRIVLIGTSLGLLVGTKYVAIPWVAILSAATLVAPLRPRSIKELILFAAPLILMGGDRYLSNMIAERNPLFPYKIPFLAFFTSTNPRLLSGLWEEQMSRGDSALYRILMSWFSPDGMSRTNYEHWYGGFGLVWPPLLACSLIVLVQAIRAKDRAYISLFLLGTLLFLATPARYTVRFVLFLPAFGAVSLGKVLDRFRSDVLRGWVVSIALLVVLHCVRQHISMLTRELLERRGTTLAASCHKVARPSAFRSLTDEPMRSILGNSEHIYVGLGSAIEDRLLSYACLWALAPDASISVHELETLPAVLAATKSTEANALVFISSRDPTPRILDPQEWDTILKDDTVSVFKAHKFP
jgi:hypothetical protein